ncbi:GGDEF domain-containing protein [Legionella pneumophila]|nr:GGDEF domain-containing protein [Legionella pneumophila]
MKTVTQSIRKGDISIRYGGEEFLIILPGASKKDALAVSEKIMRMVEDTSVNEGVQIIHVTVSIGVISYPEVNVDNEHELVKRVDEALYQAKEAGRNKICVAK